MVKDCKYTSYVDSGLQWVGSIPASWRMVPNKRVMHKEKRICEKWKNEDIMSLTMNGVVIRDLEAGGKMPSTFDGDRYVNNGELLMCLFDIDVTPRCVGRVTHSGITSPAYSCFVLDRGDVGYYYYYYLMMDNTKELLHLAKNLRHSFTEDQLGMLKVPFPPVDEQKKIAEVLDCEIEKIDVIIQQSQYIVEEYREWKKALIHQCVTKGLNRKREMKESGVQWIGKIPASWSLRKLKYGFEIVSGATPKSENAEYWDGDINWITPADYKTEEKYVASGRRKITEAGYDSCGTTMVPEGSIIFSKRAPVGTVAINTAPVCTNQGCLSCIPKLSSDAEYYYYAMSVFSEQFELFSSGTTFKEISASAFGDFVLPFPNINEQREIAKYLDNECSKMDSIIKEKLSLIEDLLSYKNSLIYEVVTGKRRVV